MKAIIKFLISFVLVLVSLVTEWSCSADKSLPTEIVTREVKTETRTVVEYVTDTVYVQTPAESSSNKTPEQRSHVETSLAESDAWIDDSGLLNHNIRNRQQPLPVPVERPVERHDSIVYVEQLVPVYVPQSVERQLTRWERVRLDWFSTLVAVLLVLCVWTFRKPLFSLLRLLKRP